MRHRFWTLLFIPVEWLAKRFIRMSGAIDDRIWRIEKDWPEEEK